MGNFDKPYEELLFRDNFMFVKTMEFYPDYCLKMLEMLLGIKIERIESISGERHIENSYGTKGVRLDVVVKDQDGSIYDAEMQVAVEADLPKRSRYYHSAINTYSLRSGSSYSELKPVYVIFICVGRLGFEKQAPVYFFRKTDAATQTVLPDGECTVIVNSDYINRFPDDGTLSTELKDFLRLVNKGRAEGGSGTLAGKIGGIVEKLKDDMKWRSEYMTLYEQMQIDKKIWVKEAREEGRSEGRIEGHRDDIITLLKKFSPEKVAELLEIPLETVLEAAETH